VWDSLSELASSLCEKRLEMAVLRPALLPVKTGLLNALSKLQTSLSILRHQNLVVVGEERRNISNKL